ncbi:MAG: Uma2 family endonuclease [Cyanobacteria bacterium J06627_32]
MTATTVQSKTYTAEEYLALEIESPIRNEFRNGEIVEMAGGTPEHNEIARMLSFLLTATLRKQPYSIFVADQRLWLPDAHLHTYPDVMVTPKPPELKIGRHDTVINPTLIVEVLSKSTQGYDRGDKFQAYRTSETFQEYVLIDQYRPYVEHYVKQAADQWLLTTYSGLEMSFTLASVGVDIELAELYEAIAFDL